MVATRSACQVTEVAHSNRQLSVYDFSGLVAKLRLMIAALVLDTSKRL